MIEKTELTMNEQSDVTDGRRLRSERSKKAILDACTELMKAGQLVTTAQMISDKASVPIRSFFRHFPDMETLFHALDATLQPEYERIFDKAIPTGSLSERILAAVKLRAEGYEETKPIFRSTKAQLWRYQALQENYARAQKRLRKNLEKRIPELTALDTDAREMIDGLASYEMWTRLRDHQKLSVARSTRLVHQMIESVLRDNR